MAIACEQVDVPVRVALEGIVRHQHRWRSDGLERGAPARWRVWCSLVRVRRAASGGGQNHGLSAVACGVGRRGVLW